VILTKTATDFIDINSNLGLQVEKCRFLSVNSAGPKLTARISLRGRVKVRNRIKVDR